MLIMLRYPNPDDKITSSNRRVSLSKNGRLFITWKNSHKDKLIRQIYDQCWKTLDDLGLSDLIAITGEIC